MKHSKYGLKRRTIRALLVALVILAMTPDVQAFDLGDALKQLGQPEEKSTDAAKEAAPETKADKKTPTLDDLAGLVKGTSTEEEIAIGQEIAGRLLGAVPLVQDEPLQTYIKGISKNY